jgi:ubiquinone/menaquinone biosynthesis C-methylase UbiE
MYVLYAENKVILAERSHLFEQFMEPLLERLDAFAGAGHVPADFVEIPQYQKVCRWPYRKLEYSFVLDALLDHLTPNTHYLDAGSGVTPLAHIFAARGVQAEACDGDARLIDSLSRLDPQQIYGSSVNYMVQDLTKLSYPDATFDAVSCVSVLEHIPAPYDQLALREMLRILKPGGAFVLTVDFTPPAKSGSSNRVGYYAKRVLDLVREGNLAEVERGAMRKLQARQAVQQGGARHARSANQCFEVAHLEQDILPVLKGEPLATRLPFSTDLHSVTPRDAKRFWDMEAGLFDAQGRRLVLPAVYSMRKPVS